MAALGAAAGAFEGDNAREEQRARRAGLGLQAASLAQNDRQFAEKQKLDREQMALDADRIAGDQMLEADRTAMMQRNADKGFALDEQKIAYDKENDLYQRGRNEQQDAWKAALDEQTIKEKQLEYETHQAEFSKYKAAQDKELEQLANREKMAKNGMSSLMQLAYMSPNGVVAKEAVSLFNKENGTNMSGAYLDKNTGNFITEEIGQDGKPVQAPVDRVKQENFLRTWAGDGVADSFFKRSDDAEKNAFNLKREEARYNSQLERDTLKAGNIVDPLKKIRYSGLQRQQDKIISELAEIDPTDTEGYATKQALLDKIEAHMVSLEGSGSPVTKPVEGDKTKYGLSKPVTGASSSASQVAPNMKALADKAMKDAGGDKAKAFKLFTQYKSELTGTGQSIQPEPIKKPYRSVYGPRAVKDGQKATGYGPDQGTVEYLRDMPTGKVTGTSKSDISQRRKEILNRLEQAYRKGPVAREEAHRIKAELDAFNTQYRP